MTFLLNSLKPVSQAGQDTPDIWVYTTTDTIATVNTSGYFDTVDKHLSVGDLIYVRSSTGGTAVYSLIVVLSIVAGVVDVSDGVNIGGESVVLNTSIIDISTADQAYVVSPIAGTITAIYSVIHGAIATADADLTAKIAGTAVTGGLITVATSGSAAGDVDSVTPSALNIVAAGDAIEVETDGASTNTIKVDITIVITPSVPDTD